MNNDKIIEGNKLIAEFMGGHLSDHPELNGVKVWHGYDLVEGRLNLPTTLTFHSSWDWLIPIWKKIVNIGDSLMSQERNLYFQEITHGLYICDIQVVWSGIVEFIEWYNQSKQI